VKILPIIGKSTALPHCHALRSPFAVSKLARKICPHSLWKVARRQLKSHHEDH
jgi:hypothetical protein